MTDFRYFIVLYPIFFFWMWRQVAKDADMSFKIITFFYFIGAISSVIILDNPNLEYQKMPISLWAILYHIVMLYFLLIPTKKLSRFSNSDLERTDNTIITLLCIIVIPFCLMEIVTSWSRFSFENLWLDVDSIRSNLMSDAEEMGEGGRNQDYLEAFSNSFHGLALALAFYLIRFYPKLKLLIIVLFICSLSQVVHSLIYAGREYMIKYIFTIVLIYILLAKNVSEDWKHVMKRGIFIITIVGSFLFITITILRFSDSNLTLYNSPLDSFFAYLGQGFINFSQRFVDFPDGLTHGTAHFSLFSGNKLSAYSIESLNLTSYRLNTFATSIGSWVVDCGIYWTVFITFVFSYLFNFVSKLRFNVFTLYYITYIYETIFSSLFFFNDNIGILRMETLGVVILLDVFSRMMKL